MKLINGKPFAKKSLGQNFLVDQNYIGEIISALDPQKNETIVEIGPGRGALTKHLVESGANVISIELDRNLVPILQDQFRDCGNFQIVEADALRTDFADIINPDSKLSNPKPVKLVANLPYYISTAILQRLIEQRELFSELVLMLQREVVDRITAQPGNSERGFLTVLVEAYTLSEKLFDVPPTAFRPVPKVWSSVVSVKLKSSSGIRNETIFREIVSAGFRQKRKTIVNNLKNISKVLYNKDVPELLEKLQIQPKLRAEDLTLDQWIGISNEF